MNLALVELVCGVRESEGTDHASFTVLWIRNVRVLNICM